MFHPWIVFVEKLNLGSRTQDTRLIVKVLDEKIKQRNDDPVK
jgi:hypothetical protein